MKIPATIQIGTDATDPTARDATVKIIDEIVAAVRHAMIDSEIIEIDDDSAIITGYIEIANPTHLD